MLQGYFSIGIPRGQKKGKKCRGGTEVGGGVGGRSSVFIGEAEEGEVSLPISRTKYRKLTWGQIRAAVVNRWSVQRQAVPGQGEGPEKRNM